MSDRVLWLVLSINIIFASNNSEAYEFTVVKKPLEVYGLKAACNPSQM